MKINKTNKSMKMRKNTFSEPLKQKSIAKHLICSIHFSFAANEYDVANGCCSKFLAKKIKNGNFFHNNSGLSSECL